MQISVRPLESPGDAEAVSRLFARVWDTSDEASPLPGDVIVAMSAWGGCVLLAFDGDDLVGATVGVAAAPHSDTLASLIAGVSPQAAGRGVGRALKEAQRQWAAERGVAGIEWTYDPLVRRNAHFNLIRLGADVVTYHVEHYPNIPDGINDGDPTDRLLVRLDVHTATPRPPADSIADAAGAVAVLTEGDDGRPRAGERPSDRPWLVATPTDVEALRRSDPDASLAWRLAMREILTAPGRSVTGFTSTGAYLVTADAS